MPPRRRRSASVIESSVEAIEFRTSIQTGRVSQLGIERAEFVGQVFGDAIHRRDRTFHHAVDLADADMLWSSGELISARRASAADDKP